MNLRKVILFAGTKEGRILAEALRDHGNVEIHVATTYGENLLPKSHGNYRVCRGRLDKNQMVQFINDLRVQPIVIDATHPFAVEVTENIKSAARETGALYFRVVRDSNFEGEFGNSDFKGQLEKSELIEKVDRKDGEYFHKNIIYVDSIEEAAKVLEKISEKALITTGSKELAPFTKIKEYKELLTVRILPLEDAFHKAIEAGFEGRNLVAMQGPFSVKMNRALIEMTGAKVLVTKESGKVGGFTEKLIACREENIKALVIKRPEQEKGYSLSEIFKILLELGIKVRKDADKAALAINEDAAYKAALAINEDAAYKAALEINENAADKAALAIKENAADKVVLTDDKKRWFPIFMDSRGKKALVIGSGKIAMRRIRTLLKFQWHVTVWTKEISKELWELLKDSELERIDEFGSAGDFNKIGQFENEKKFGKGMISVEERELLKEQVLDMDFEGFHMVIAGTDDAQLNQVIYGRALEFGKWVNDASCKENCNFYFPAISLKGDLTVGINGQGKDHKMVSVAREKIDKLFEED